MIRSCIKLYHRNKFRLIFQVRRILVKRSHITTITQRLLSGFLRKDINKKKIPLYVCKSHIQTVNLLFVNRESRKSIYVTRDICR